MLFACSKEDAEKNKSETVSQNTKKTETKTPPQKETEKLQKWYYFVKNNKGNLEIKQTSSINSIPKTDFLPWTESLRLVSVGLMYEKPILLINRGGIITVTDIKKNAEFESSEIFTTKTIDGFYKTDLGVLIRAYTDIIFSELPKNLNQSQNYCVYRYNSLNKKLIPIIDTESLKLAKKAQLTKLVYGKNWLASFKTDQNNKVDFNYIEFSNFEKLKNGEFSQMSHEEFMDKTKTEKLISIDIKDFKKNIIENKHKNIRLEVFKKEASNKIVYIKKETKHTLNIDDELEDSTQDNDASLSEEEKEITATACEFNTSVDNKYKKAILFSNGEFLYSKNGKKWNKDTLPKLPKNFVYTYFVIYKGKIWAAWEEQNFFQVGRTGLLEKKLK